MDNLTKLFEEWKAANPDATDFQAFQAGFTKSAMSMRERAVKLAQNRTPADNDLINAIGALSDIP